MAARNLVVVTVDCLRYDRCGFDGYHRDTTPTLDRLAGESRVYDRAYATGPSTSQSLPGLLAGLLSAECGAADGAIGIPSGAPTVASALADRGFDTGAVITNPAARAELNVSRGFDHFENLDVASIFAGGAGGNEEAAGPLARQASRLSDVVGDLNSWASEAIRRGDTPLSPVARQVFLAHRYRQYHRGWPTTRAGEVLDAFADHLRTMETPFFGWTHLMDLHSPIHPDTVAKGGLAASDSPRYCFRADRNRLAQRPDPRYGDVYDSALRGVDALLGAFVETLQAMGRWEDTALVVTADHGEALGDRGIYSHPAHYVFDELLHVPLLVRVPGEGSTRVAEPTSLRSFHRLAADVLGVDEPLLEPAADRPGDDVLVADAISPLGHTVTTRSAAYKYTTHRGGPLAEKYAWMPEWEYDWTRRDLTYHVASDPGEHVPLDGDRAPERLRRVADELLTSLGALPPLDAEVHPALDRRLAELGYRD